MATTPKSGLATLRPDLAYAMMAFDLQANINAMVGMKIAPVMEVPEQFGNWGKIPLEELLKNRSDTRAPGERYNQGGGRFSPATYNCLEHSIEEAVDDRESKMYANYFDSEVIAAMRARHIVLQNYENRIIAAVQAVAQTASASVNWSTQASALPIQDMTGWKNTFFQQIGMWPNAFALSRQKFNKARNAQEVIERVKYSELATPGIIASIFAQALDIEEVIVAGAAQNTATEGATPVIASSWPDRYGILFLKAKTVDVREPCFMRTFHWGEDGSSIGGGVETYRDESRRSNMVRCRMDTDEHVMYSQAALYVDLGTL